MSHTWSRVGHVPHGTKCGTCSQEVTPQGNIQLTLAIKLWPGDLKCNLGSNNNNNNIQNVYSALYNL